jgi:hypothetical protein
MWYAWGMELKQILVAMGCSTVVSGPLGSGKTQAREDVPVRWIHG